MARIYSVPAGKPIAQLCARYVLSENGAVGLPDTIIFLPNRRACVVMREAFVDELGGKAALLPRMLPLADIENELVSLMGDAAFDVFASIPAAMSESERRYILTQQVLTYERKRMGAVTLHYALSMADAIIELQDNCTRAGVTITQENLRQLYHADFADHWREALLFLGILTDTWPAIEAAYGRTTHAQREVLVLQSLSHYWRETPPDFPVIAVGSTASQPSTAALLKTVAELPRGSVILPGMNPNMPAADWARIGAGHPLFHLKQFLQQWLLSPSQVVPLADDKNSIWLEALLPTEAIVEWSSRVLPDHQSLKIIPCAHPEEEARVISLLLREGLETPNAEIALITPDESLMARVAAHMLRYGITLDRLNAGTLAGTKTGTLWLALIAALREPHRQLSMRTLLNHPLLSIDVALLAGLEKGWYGLNRTRAGHLPRHDASLSQHPHYATLANWIKRIASFTRASMLPSEWLNECEILLSEWQVVTGQGGDAVAEKLNNILDADNLGAMSIDDFEALVRERLNAKWRHAGMNTHPRIHMLTPVEARLQQFDRVILANMQEQQWPGITRPNPWLNQAAQKALGLPSSEEHISLMAHDVLMHASSGEVFLTYPKREGGSPTTRSRFIERLVTLLAVHGINEAQIIASHYPHWAQQLYASATYQPEPPVSPLPSIGERPQRISATSVDILFTDPFSIYAKYVLGLRALEAIDADPEASDFGSLTHRALEELTLHWNTAQAAATEERLAEIAQAALRAISERPNIDLFWRNRLLGALRYVNGLEAQRRLILTDVEPEHTLESSLTLNGDRKPTQSLTLHGRIDRLEKSVNGYTIVDYKTGDIPSKNQILEGKALQMLVYAMLLENEGKSVAGVEYWQLPKLGEVGETLAISAEEIPIDIPEKLHAAFRQMLDPATPFLARPVASATSDRYGNDYDGISRYDEWAG